RLIEEMLMLPADRINFSLTQAYKGLSASYQHHEDPHIIFSTLMGMPDGYVNDEFLCNLNALIRHSMSTDMRIKIMNILYKIDVKWHKNLLKTIGTMCAHNMEEPVSQGSLFVNGMKNIQCYNIIYALSTIPPVHYGIKLGQALKGELNSTMTGNEMAQIVLSTLRIKE
ncbi:MAG: hypothetical protein Q8K36_01215, partial [Alphaproteobacteria bacterium]|nr:hypothetical protein [Alphaproteobacteria bacterium]